jgi:hypothetical protein
MISTRDCVVALAAASMTLMVSTALSHHGEHMTTTGRAKSRGDKAFVLSVGLRFEDNASVETLLHAWEKAADFCLAHEPFLFAYEVAQSDKGVLPFSLHCTFAVR